MSDRETDPTQWRHANPILDVADVSRAIAFYRDVFGLIPALMWEDNVGGVTTEVAPIEFYLSRADKIETKPWGLRGFTVKDPDGNLIGISHEVHSPEHDPRYRDLGAGEQPAPGVPT